jgi:hypothetical protein
MIKFAIIKDDNLFNIEKVINDNKLDVVSIVFQPQTLTSDTKTIIWYRCDTPVDVETKSEQYKISYID